MWSALAGAAMAGTYAAVIRPWFLKWGATPEEVEREWPGDALVPDAPTISTRAITIDAPASVVWRWLIQIGQDRAGFYSYRWLENLARADMPEIHALMPEFAKRSPGETVWLARPDRYGGRARMVIGLLIEGRALILVATEDADRALTEGRAPSGTWGFLVEPIDARRTRLIARSRAGTRKDVAARVADLGFWEPAHFVMERRMLMTIKRLAEASIAEPIDSPPAESRRPSPATV
jgi:hypothetical protein